MAMLLLAANIGFSAEKREEIPLKEGARFDFLGHTVTIKKADILPFVENEYSRPVSVRSLRKPKIVKAANSISPR